MQICQIDTVPMTCCCCNAPMRVGLQPWHWQCAACGYEAARFAPGINDAARHTLVDEAGREKGLHALRVANFSALLTRIAQFATPDTKRLLDVGAAHGWFVRMAAERYDALGIEPDHAVWQRAVAQGVPLVNGYFPQALAAEDRFGVIVFNDVLEHIPDVAQCLRACATHLAPGGLLVLNLPSSQGLFYQTSRLLRRLGAGGPFDRMWQKGLPSPHLHYFNAANLLALTGRVGFAKAYVGELPSIRFRGLYDRIAYVGDTPRWRSGLTWCALTLALPLVKLFKSDIAVVMVRKTDN